MNERFPTHIAITMDGNGRWGKERGLSRSQGHFAGSKSMENIINACLELGIKIITLYAFSTENWSRPKEEVNYLMKLPAKYLRKKLPEYMKKNIKVCVSGDIEGLPSHTKKAVMTAVHETRNNTKLIVNFALNYGGRQEILSSIKSIIGEMKINNVNSKDIDEELFNQYLYTGGLPDPDIIIRTGKEKRLSNFLLWQAAMSNLWFTDTYFPDFTKQMLIQAIKEVNQRNTNKNEGIS